MPTHIINKYANVANSPYMVAQRNGVYFSAGITTIPVIHTQFPCVCTQIKEHRCRVEDTITIYMQRFFFGIASYVIYVKFEYIFLKE